MRVIVIFKTNETKVFLLILKKNKEEGNFRIEARDVIHVCVN